MTNMIMLYTGAATLGALHAFEPGHGKTLIAAYMIGSRGRAWDGFLLGAIVTFTHTFSVILLGIVARILSHNYSETELHNWLGLVSAVIIICVGLWMLKQRVGGSSRHGHVHLFSTKNNHTDHPPHHDQDHHHHVSHDALHTHDHFHTSDHTRPKAGQQRYDKWNLLLLGISGGIIPCPAAIATLLAAIAAGRIAQGLTMTIFFSLGLGLVMMSIGVALSQTGRLTNKISENLDFGRRMGIVSATIIVSLGSYTMFNSVKSIWF